MASTVAIATERFSPPERRYGGRSARCSPPTRASAAATRAATSVAESPRLSGPNATSSATVGRKSWSSGSWKTMPTVRRMSGRVPLVTGMPPMSTLPRSGVSSPFRWSSSVDLPAPLAPTTAIASPWPTSNETPSSARVPSGYE